MPYYIRDPNRDPNIDNHPYTYYIPYIDSEGSLEHPKKSLRAHIRGPYFQPWIFMGFRVQGIAFMLHMGFRGLGA